MTRSLYIKGLVSITFAIVRSLIMQERHIIRFRHYWTSVMQACTRLYILYAKKICACLIAHNLTTAQKKDSCRLMQNKMPNKYNSVSKAVYHIYIHRSRMLYLYVNESNPSCSRIMHSKTVDDRRIAYSEFYMAICLLEVFEEVKKHNDTGSFFTMITKFHSLIFNRSKHRLMSHGLYSPLT